MQICLAGQKLRDLQAHLPFSIPDSCFQTTRTSGTKRNLPSLIGVLHDEVSVVRPSCTFICSLISVSMTERSLDHHVHLHMQFHADNKRWLLFASLSNGTSLLPPQAVLSIQLHQSHGTVVHYASYTQALQTHLAIVIAIAVCGARWGYTEYKG